MPLVKIIVQNDDPSKTRISNVNIYIYTINAVPVTSGVTNQSGELIISLPDGTYDCLFFKQGCTITQPQRLIIDSLLTNDFTVTGHLRVMPEGLDPVYCRVSGFIYSADGLSTKDLTIRFNPLPLNTIVNNNLIFNDPVEVISDKKGYFQFDLIRGIKYEASVPGYPLALIVKVPAAPAVNISSLLFPIPVNITLTTTNLTTSLLGGPNSSVGYTVTYSDLNTGKLYNDWSSIEVNYTVENKVTISSNDTNLIINPINLGSTAVSFVRVINSNFVWVNPTPFTSPVLNININ